MRIWEYKKNWFRFFFFFFFPRLMMRALVSKYVREVHRIEISFFLTLMRALCSGVRVLRYANWFPLLQPKLPNAIAAARMRRLRTPESHTRFRVCGPDQTRPDQTTAMHASRAGTKIRGLAISGSHDPNWPRALQNRLQNRGSWYPCSSKETHGKTPSVAVPYDGYQ